MSKHSNAFGVQVFLASHLKHSMKSNYKVYSFVQIHPLCVRKRMAADYLEWATTTKSDVIRNEALKRVEELLV